MIENYVHLDNRTPRGYTCNDNFAHLNKTHAGDYLDG